LKMSVVLALIFVFSQHIVKKIQFNAFSVCFSILKCIHLKKKVAVSGYCEMEY